MPQIDLQQAVKLPEGEDLFEWLAKNINDFYRQVSMLFSVMTEFCTNERCCTMSAGPGYRYLWSDEKNPTPAEVTAPEYLTKLLKWIDGLLEDETVFPSTLNVQFPDDFMSIVKNIMKRLFRFYAHCYYHHIDDFHYLKMSSLLDTSFKHFILFTHEFDLIPPDQLEPLPGNNSGASISAQTGIAGEVVKNKTILNIHDATKDTRYDPSEDQRTGFVTHNLLAAPIMNAEDGSVLGIVQLLNKVSLKIRNPGELNTMRSFLNIPNRLNVPMPYKIEMNHGVLPHKELKQVLQEDKIKFDKNNFKFWKLFNLTER